MAEKRYRKVIVERYTKDGYKDRLILQSRLKKFALSKAASIVDQLVPVEKRRPAFEFRAMETHKRLVIGLFYDGYPEASDDED